MPNIRGINIDTMKLIIGDSWPPARGYFNWKLSFTIETADIDLDLANASAAIRLFVNLFFFFSSVVSPSVVEVGAGGGQTECFQFL